MQRDFKGIWIPKELWLLKDLNLTEKIMLIEIDSLDNENGCFATNDYFADFFGLSKGHISRIINGLAQRGYIISEIKYKKGTQIVEKRTLKVCRWCKSKTNCPYMQKQTEGIGKNVEPYAQRQHQPMGENVEYNKLENKLNNNINSSSQIFAGDPAGQVCTQNILENPDYMLAKTKISDVKMSKKKIFSPDSNAYRLAYFLEGEILENNPKFPQSEQQRQRWAKDIDLMIRRDKLNADDIAGVIMWCQSDNFWRSNILSGKKLREKYQQLSMRMATKQR